MTTCLYQAGSIIMKYYQKKNYNVSMKGVGNPLTEADLASNDFILETIQKQFPQDAVLSEEQFPNDIESKFPERHKSKRVWIIDPIDGTKEFIDGIPEFSISVGLIDQKEPVLGFIFNPATNFFIYGGEGIGLFINSKLFINKLKPVKTPEDIYPCFSRSEIKKGLLGHYQKKYPIQEKQILGSIAYKLALIASGEFNLTVSYKPKNEWDIAAGLCLFKSIGYDILDLDQKPIQLNKENTKSEGIIGGDTQAIKLYHDMFF